MAKRITSTSGLPGTGGSIIVPPPPVKSRVRRTKAQIAADEAARQIAEPQREEQPTQNGVTRPNEGTVTRRIWEIADYISGQVQRPATKAEVVQAALNEQLQAGTATTHYINWARFWGLVEALPAVAPVFAPPPPVDAPLEFGAQTAALPQPQPQAPVYFEQPVVFPQPPLEVVIEPRPVPDRAAAWESGYGAYQDGYRKDRNPFTRVSFQYEAWGAGWDSAKGDDRSAEADA